MAKPILGGLHLSTDSRKSLPEVEGKGVRWRPVLRQNFIRLKAIDYLTGPIAQFKNVTLSQEFLN